MGIGNDLINDFMYELEYINYERLERHFTLLEEGMIWININNNKIPIRCMSSDYIKNVINFINRKYKGTFIDRYIKLLKTELEKRED